MPHIRPQHHHLAVTAAPRGWGAAIDDADIDLTNEDLLENLEFGRD